MFEIPERTVILDLLDSEFAGAEVEVRTSVPLSLARAIDLALAQGGMAGLDEAIAAFVGKALVRWNLSQGGVAIPATVEGMNDLPPELITAILKGWGTALSGVPAPLVEPSDDGAPSEAPSEQTEP